MLSTFGLITILSVLVAILSKRAAPLVALTLIPILVTLFIGQAQYLSDYVVSGMVTVAPMAAMFLFAILFFGLLSDAGLFAPVVKAIVSFTQGKPARIALGTAVLTSLVHMDGSGASTFLVVIPAMLPIYDRLGMDRRLLACIVGMAAGIGNMLPWGGPTIRAAAALDVPVMELFYPLIPVYLTGLISMFVLSWLLGARETGRISGKSDIQYTELKLDSKIIDNHQDERKGAHFWINLAIVIAVITALFSGVLAPAVAFMIGTILILLVNFPKLEAQAKAIESHAVSGAFMVALLFAAGAFTGIMQGTGMLTALADAGANFIAPEAVEHLPFVLAVFSMPLSLLFDPDSFYFGLLPVFANIVENNGIAASEVAHAALLGQMTTGFPISPLTPATFLLIGLARVDLAEHQRYTAPFLLLLSLIMTVSAVVLGVISL